MGAILASRLRAGFVPIRKPNKLPGEILEEVYLKEYGEDRIQIHKDSLCSDDIVLIHDDLLATGGTVTAACDLISKLGVQKIFINFIIELEALDGRKHIEDKFEITSIIKFKD